MKRYILFAFTIPWTITVGWGWVLLMCAIRAAGDLGWETSSPEVGVLTAVWKPWAAARWPYSTTLGRGIIYSPGERNEPWTRTQQHEHVHVRQVEDQMMLSFVIGLVVLTQGSPLLGVVLWLSGGAWQLPNFLTAVLRGGNVYRDTEHERSAYAQTDELHDGKDSWLASWLRYRDRK